jgi:hypothetical protein
MPFWEIIQIEAVDKTSIKSVDWAGCNWMQFFPSESAFHHRISQLLNYSVRLSFLQYAFLSYTVTIAGNNKRQLAKLVDNTATAPDNTLAEVP